MQAAPTSEQNKAPGPEAGAGQASQNGERPLYEDFDALTTYLTGISGKSQELISEYFANPENLRRTPASCRVIPLNVGEAFQEMMKGLALDPGTVMQRQFNLWGDYAKMMATMSRRMSGEQVTPTVEPAKGDKRFNHPAWTENPMLDFVKQSYLVFGRWLEGTVSQLDEVDPHEKAKAPILHQTICRCFRTVKFRHVEPRGCRSDDRKSRRKSIKGLEKFAGGH